MNSQIVDLFKVARITYLVGMPQIGDKEYDILKEQVSKEFPDLPELNQLYEEDNIDFEALRRCNCNENALALYIATRGISKEFKYQKSLELLNDENVSILPKKSTDEVMDTFRELGYGKYVVSPKIDGIFLSVIYERLSDNKFAFASAQTRGSTTDAVDVSRNVKFIVPNILTIENLDTDSIKFNFEGTMDRQSSMINNYATPRSGAQSVLMSTTNRKLELFEKVMLLCHGCSYAQSNEDIYSEATKAGFNVVPSEVIDISEDSDVEELERSLSEKFSEWAEAKLIDIDGIVFKKVDNSIKGRAVEGSKIYKQDTFASKTYFWSSGEYEGLVDKIITSQRDSRISYTLLLKPVKTKTNVVSRLTNINLNVLVTNNIMPGDTVLFEYNNNTTPKFIKKKVPIENGCERTHQFY